MKIFLYIDVSYKEGCRAILHFGIKFFVAKRFTIPTACDSLKTNKSESAKSKPNAMNGFNYLRIICTRKMVMSLVISNGSNYNTDDDVHGG